jgi:hypothetical protein
VVLNNRVKIVEPTIIGSLTNVERIKCELRNGYFVAKEGHDIKLFPYKRCLKQFRIPYMMLPYIGKEVTVERDFLNMEQGELFRIIPKNFEIISCEPYFTNNHLYVTRSYIQRYLDERAPLLNMSLMSTIVKMISEGTIHVILTENGGALTSSFRPHGNSMRAKIIAGMTRVMNEAGCVFTDFEYHSTTEKDKFNKYGVMVFKRREIHGQDIPAVC